MNTATLEYLDEVRQRLRDLACLQGRAEGIRDKAQRQRVMGDIYRRQDALLEELQLLDEGSDDERQPDQRPPV